MENELKLLLGKILGETYRIQKRTKGMVCSASNQTIYGLVNGIESAVNDELRSLKEADLSQDNVDKVSAILDEIYIDPEEMAKVTGYYSIQNKLNDAGIDRGQALKIITYFNEGGMFEELIAKMNSSNSPIECKTFDVKSEDR